MGQDFELHGRTIFLRVFGGPSCSLKVLTWGFQSFFFSLPIHVHIFDTGRHRIRTISHMLLPSPAYIAEFDRMVKVTLAEVMY